MAGIQFTQYVPTSLVGNNSPSPTLAAEVVTGMPIPTGAFPGNVFYLTEQQANQLSATSVNGAPVLQCHAGWYMVVQVAATATANLIAQGLIGAQAALTSASATTPAQSIVTDVVHSAAAVGSGQNPVVFLNAVTPGNYTIVQVAGDASVLATAAVTLGGLYAYSAATGQVTALTAAPTNVQYPLITGIGEATTAAAGLARLNVKFPFGVV